MGVASLIAECFQFGVPVDFAKLSTESMGMTADQVMELRLEQLLLARKLEMSKEHRTSEALDLQKQLEEVSKQKEDEVNVRIDLNHQLEKKEEEIRSLKAEIQKMRKDFGEEPGVPMESSPEEVDVEDFETIFRKGEMDFGPGNEHGGSEDGSPPDNESQAHVDGEMVDESTPTSSHADPDFQSFQPHSTSSSGDDQLDLQLPAFQGNSNDGNVTDIRDEHEDVESSNIQPDEEDSDKEEEADKRSSNSDDDPPILECYERPADAGVSQAGPPILQPEVSVPAYHLRRRRVPIIYERDSSRSISSLQSGSSFSGRWPSWRPNLLTTNRKSGMPKLERFPPPKGINCPLCSKLLKNQQILKWHLFSIHKSDPQVLKCCPCFLGFLSKLELQRHNLRCRRKNNSQKSRLRCKFCSKVFNSRTSCLRHEMMHRGRNGSVVRAQCKFCPKSYPIFQTLKRHVKEKHAHLMQPLVEEVNVKIVKLEY